MAAPPLRNSERVIVSIQGLGRPGAAGRAGTEKPTSSIMPSSS